MSLETATKATTPKGWINKSNLAASLGISVQAFTKWGIEPVAKIGREVFFTVEDVIDYCVARAERRERKKAETTTFEEIV